MMSRIYDKFRLKRHLNIRILELQPGKQDDPIQCKLRCAELGKTSPYECLSYEWHPETSPGTVTIQCEGNPIDAAANLHAALRALRYPDKPRILWVDALCINQNDMAERNKQIPLMTQIYQSASCVIMWLGPLGEMTEKAIAIAKVLAVLWEQRIPKGAGEDDYFDFILHDRSELDNEAVFHMPKVGVWVSSSSLAESLLSKRPLETCYLSPKSGLQGSELFEFDNEVAWTALDDLFANTFFSRAWIVQEVAVAQRAQVQCGSLSLPWEVFRAAYDARKLLIFQKEKFSKECARSSAVSTVRDARKRFRDVSFRTTLATTMSLFTFSKATDPRDFIYAALGLVKNNGIHGWPCDIVPDYHKKVEKVYLEAASHMIVKEQDLYLWGRNDPPSRKHLKKLPTWVPDWSIESDPNAMLHCDTMFAKHFAGQPAPEGRRLKVNAHLLDEICLVTPVEDEPDPLCPMPEVIRLFEKMGWGLYDAYRGGLTKPNPSLLQELSSTQLRPLDNHLNIEALWITLGDKGFFQREDSENVLFRLILAGWYYASWQTVHPSRDWPLSDLPPPYSSWVLAAVAASEAGPTWSWDELVAEHMHKVVAGEDLFVTKSGYFGRSPKGVAKEGHQVAIIGGAYRPYLLERQTHGHYHFVSHAYVQGIMDVRELAPDMEVTRIELQ